MTDYPPIPIPGVSILWLPGGERGAVLKDGEDTGVRIDAGWPVDWSDIVIKIGESLAPAMTHGHRPSLEMVREFHTAFRLPIDNRPGLHSERTALLRLHLIQEELSELAIALAERDPVKILDALADLQYVLDGSFLSLGLAGVKDEAMAEVHRSNMTKLVDGEPVLTPGGRVAKPETYSPADFRGILDKKGLLDPKKS